jgi:flagellin-like hook-associated protein FlgL
MLALQDNAVGSSSRISIYNANALASSVLGITNGGISGAGSSARIVTAGTRLSGADQLTPDAFNFRLVDGTGNEVHIPFPAGASLTSNTAFGGTDIAAYINANRGPVRVQAEYVSTSAWNGTLTPLTSGALESQPLPFDLDLNIRENFPGFDETVNVIIPAGTDLSTFDFTTIDLSPTNLTMSNTGGNLMITPDPRGPNLAAYNFSLSINNALPEGLNEGSRFLGLNTGSRLRLRSMDTGSNTQFLWQVTGPSPADATTIGNGLGLNGSYGTLQAEDGFGANSPAAPGFTAPRRPDGNGDIFHDDGEVPNWTDPQYTQHARFTPAGYTVNRAVESTPGGAAGLTFGATTIMRDLGLEGLMDSQTALAHNSDTVSLKSVAGIGDVSAFAKLTPVPITVLKNTENTEFDIQLPTGASLRISLVKALPPDGVIVGLTMDELDESLRQKLTPANLTYNLNRDIPEVTIRSRELGKNASFSVAPTPEIGFIRYSGYGHDSYSINMQESRQVFQVGANQSQQVRIGIGNMESASLGVKNLQVGSVKQATDALHRLDAASNIVMATQAKLGAFENRMQHVSQSLQQTALNITSADSRIRDTDIAHESVLQSKVSMQQDLSTQIIKRIPQMTKRLWEQLLAAKQTGNAN